MLHLIPSLWSIHTCLCLRYCCGRLRLRFDLGLRLDLDAGTLQFFLNGQRHGPGHGGIRGPVQRCVEIFREGDAVELCDDVSFS